MSHDSCLEMAVVLQAPEACIRASNPCSTLKRVVLSGLGTVPVKSQKSAARLCTPPNYKIGLFQDLVIFLDRVVALLCQCVPYSIIRKAEQGEHAMQTQSLRSLQPFTFRAFTLL